METTMEKARIQRASLASLVGIVAFSSGVFAQDTPSKNYAAFNATPGTPVQLGYYASAHKDCTPAPQPVVRLVEAPKSGTLTVRTGELTTNSIAGCPGLKIKAEVVFYAARAGTSDTDRLSYEVDSVNGERAQYEVTIHIVGTPQKLPGVNQKI